MKKAAIIGAIALSFAGIAWASCTTHTLTTANGRIIMCTTCCYGGNCTTNCF